jgi:hypothetical protein
VVFLPGDSVPGDSKGARCLNVWDYCPGYDEPQGYSAPLTMFLLSEVTAARFKVALAGDGGDELFGWKEGM